jgi:predicted O-methyltransferase YrrM
VRYGQLIAACFKAQPAAILEIGTWNGERALQLLQAAPYARYYGFDLFEDATAVTDAEEMNVKRHWPLADVEHKLKGYRALLTKGNTRDTLAKFNHPVDFVWMDGGHSVETIASDFAHVRRLALLDFDNVRRAALPEAAIYLDDYYTGPIDVTKFGCNQLVAGLKHEVLPAADPVTGGGLVQMVRVWL